MPWDGISGVVSTQPPITPPAGGEWTRPVDRPAVPEIVNESEIYMLFGVRDGWQNDYAFLIQTDAVDTNYRVDWGDGTVETVTRNVKAEHVYNFNTLTIPTSSEGLKWVWIKVTAVGTGYFTIFNLVQRPTNRPAMSSSAIWEPQIYEIYMRGLGINSFGFGSLTYNYYSFLNIFDFQGGNSISSFAYIFANSYELRKFNMDISNGLSFVYMLQNAYKLNGIGNLNQPLILNNITSAAYFLNNCYSWTQQIIINGPCTTFQSFASLWLDYNKSLILNTSNSITMFNFASMPSYEGILDLDLSSLTTAPTTTFIGGNCRRLTGLRLRNMTTICNIFSITSTQMLAPALEQIIDDLVDRTGLSAGTCTLSGNRGVQDISPTAKQLAVDKNWTLVL